MYNRVDYEIVVQDNSDSDEILHYIEQLNDSRIKYKRIPERINSVINMNLAVEAATGKFVTMIGDDDYVLPELFEALDIMEKKDLDCISPNHYDAFLWNVDNDKSLGTYITFPKTYRYSRFHPKDELTKFLRNGLISYQSFKLPKLYHGLVRRDKLEIIKKKTGHIIGGLSPDIYLAVGLSFIIDKCEMCYFPLTIQGISPSSTAYAGMHGTHKGNLSQAPHLYKRGEYKWNERIPKVYSVETIWADSALCAIEEISEDSKLWIELFNKNYFDTVFHLNNSNIKKFFPAEFKNHPLSCKCGYKFLYRKYKSKFRSLMWRIHGRKKYVGTKGWDGVYERVSKEYTIREAE